MQGDPWPTYAPVEGADGYALEGGAPTPPRTLHLRILQQLQQAEQLLAMPLALAQQVTWVGGSITLPRPQQPYEFPSMRRKLAAVAQLLGEVPVVDFGASGFTVGVESLGMGGCIYHLLQSLQPLLAAHVSVLGLRGSEVTVELLRSQIIHLKVCVRDVGVGIGSVNARVGVIGLMVRDHAYRWFWLLARSLALRSTCFIILVLSYLYSLCILHTAISSHHPSPSLLLVAVCVCLPHGLSPAHFPPPRPPCSCLNLPSTVAIFELVCGGDWGAWVSLS